MTKKQLDAILGANIRKERTARGLSIEDLSELIDCTPGFLGLLERGNRGTTTLTLCKLSVIFNQPVGEFFLNVEEESTDEDLGLRDKISSLMYDFTTEELAFLIEVIKGLRQLNR